MAAGKYTIKIDQGESYSQIFEWRDENNEPKDLTGLSMRGQVRDKYDGSLILDLAVTPLDQVTNKGQYSVEVTPLKSSKIKVAKSDSHVRKITTYIYDVEAYIGTNFSKRVTEGDFEVSPKVTKSE